eukprot:g40380.t1
MEDFGGAETEGISERIPEYVAYVTEGTSNDDGQRKNECTKGQNQETEFGKQVVNLEEAKDGHVIRGVGGGIKMDGNWKVGSVDACREQMLRKPVPGSAFALPDTEETTSGATDAIDK